MEKFKKVLALMFACIMVMSVAVPAFADSGMTVIDLKEMAGKETNDPNEMIEIVDYSDCELLGVNNEATGRFLVGPESADYYFWFRSETAVKNVKLSASGNIAAKVVKYDHDHMFCADQQYYVSLGNDRSENPIPIELLFTEGTGDKTHVTANVPGEESLEADIGYSFAKYGEDIEADFEGTEGEYAFLDAVVKALNMTVKTKKFRVVDIFEENADRYVLVKVTTKDNYSMSYTDGKLKVVGETGTGKDRKMVGAEITIISDVNVFDPDEVAWAVDSGYNMNTHSARGYSDYFFSNQKYVYDYLDEDEVITVVTTKTFGEIKGEDLTIETYGESVRDDNENFYLDVEVDIEKVDAKQKGMNFAFKGPRLVNKDGTVYDLDELSAKQKKEWETYGIEFGFPGADTVASGSKVTFEFTNFTNEDLLKTFGVDLSKEKEVAFHIVKDGKDIGEYKVNVGDKSNRNEEVKFTVKLDAGSTLGMYRIQLEKVDTPKAGGEENPNTGAPVNTIGVFAAIGVVAAVAGAACLIGKKH